MLLSLLLVTTYCVAYHTIAEWNLAVHGCHFYLSWTINIGISWDFVGFHGIGDNSIPSVICSLRQVFSDVDEKSPCVFLLSRGADPVALLMKFASHLGMENSLEFLSLGKGQGPRAEEIIKVNRVSVSGFRVVCNLESLT